jgi:glycosyltransferase involved in cell wall biosynthesis
MAFSDPRIVAVAPMVSEFNAFTGRFAQALRDAGVQPVEYEWGLRGLMQCDAVIFHWPDAFMNARDWKLACEQLLRLQFCKIVRGLKVVWLAHNALPHDTQGSGALLRHAFLRSLDGVIYLSERSRELVREAHCLPRGIVEQVTVHGAYPRSGRAFVPPAPDDSVRLASVGLVRPYKNLSELAEAARGVAQRRIEVTIVGKRHDADYAAHLEAATGPDSAVRFQLSDALLSPDEIDAAIDRAHGVVLPYRKILNSGSAIHALSRARPVLVPAVGSMSELAELVGQDWVRLYEGEITPQVLTGFADHVRTMRPGGVPDLSALSWDRVTQDLRGFLGKLFAREEAMASLPARQALR